MEIREVRKPVSGSGIFFALLWLVIVLPICIVFLGLGLGIGIAVLIAIIGRILKPKKFVVVEEHQDKKKIDPETGTYS